MKSPIAKLIFGFLFCLFLANTLKAQEKSDYVIKSNGDTLKCEITSSFSSMFYKTADMKERAEIDMKNIKEYSRYHQKEYYRVIQKVGLPDSDYFKIVEKGRISLYEMDLSVGSPAMSLSFGGSKFDYLYVSKDGGEVVPLSYFSNSFQGGMGIGKWKSEKERQQMFEDLIKDNKAVYDKYKADYDFTFRLLKKTVHLYNTGKEK